MCSSQRLHCVQQADSRSLKCRGSTYAKADAIFPPADVRVAGLLAGQQDTHTTSHANIDKAASQTTGGNNTVNQTLLCHPNCKTTTDCRRRTLCTEPNRSHVRNQTQQSAQPLRTCPAAIACHLARTDKTPPWIEAWGWYSSICLEFPSNIPAQQQGEEATKATTSQSNRHPHQTHALTRADSLAHQSCALPVRTPTCSKTPTCSQEPQQTMHLCNPPPRPTRGTQDKAQSRLQDFATHTLCSPIRNSDAAGISYKTTPEQCVCTAPMRCQHGRTAIRVAKQPCP